LSGTGTLSVQNGGTVSNATNGEIGVNAGSTGTVTVTGAGSSWTIFLLVPRTQAARVLRAGPILLCMGLFSRFCVWALRAAEEALRWKTL
jgi:hypothetical protein